nr:MAG TPA: hypothetical protein [Caudoviricetes sp.]
MNKLIELWVRERIAVPPRRFCVRTYPIKCF